MGLPVALKGIHPKVTHRAKAGLVALDLQKAEDVMAAYHAIHERARQISIELEGLYVQKMHSDGIELLATTFRDPLFGTMVSCGAVGNWTELIDNVITERAPVDHKLAANMVERLRVHQYAMNTTDPVETEPIADFITAFSELAMTAPWKQFILEVNPVKCTNEGVVAVDGLLIIEHN